MNKYNNLLLSYEQKILVLIHSLSGLIKYPVDRKGGGVKSWSGCRGEETVLGPTDTSVVLPVVKGYTNNNQDHWVSGLLSTVRNCKHKGTQCFGNWIRFRPQVRETPTVLGSLGTPTEFRTMDRAQKPSNSECYTPSSQPFGFYQLRYPSSTPKYIVLNEILVVQCNYLGALCKLSRSQRVRRSDGW
jgi:hypothetical protein